MFAVTDRLLLRPGWAEDAPALTRAIANEKIARNLAMLPWPYGEDDARGFIGFMWGGHPVEFLITRRDTSEIIGGIGLHDDPDEPGEQELGYWIAEPHWGQGYATEAGRAVLDIARDTLRLPRLRSAWFHDNPASGRVLAKLGFRPTGQIVPRRSVGRGESVPAVLVAQALAAEGDAPLPPMRSSAQMQMQLAA
jgi:RimJ/RimL family protein N-acetyltransferase